ncbi:methyl-accepting chemotaxis transducer [Stutzerimonas stutzeri]|nr:methyl-accepting chemotaxis transducer [Stutzerimonas stutzeri]
MQLSPSERHWLPWLGRTGKLSMGWSCWLNRGVYPAIEQVFEGVAQSRVRILQNWVSAHWDHLADLAASLGEGLAHVDVDLLEKKRAQLPDLSELFVIDPQGGYWRPRAPRMSVSRIWMRRPLRGGCASRSCMALIAIR